MKSNNRTMKIILGTMTWGPNAQTPKSEALKQIYAAMDGFSKNPAIHQDIIHLDTARMYQAGQTESLIGEILSENKEIRNKIWIDTKVAPAIKPFTKDNLRSELDQSLKNLRIDKIHTWYLHIPDVKTPIEETLDTIDELYCQGKFEKFGLSNYAAWDVLRIQMLCKENGWIAPSVYQGAYNVLNKTIEAELLPAIRWSNISFVGYNPLAGGLLTGRYSNLHDLETAKVGRFSAQFDFVPKKGEVIEGLKFMQGKGNLMYQKRYGNDHNFEALNLVRKQLEKSDINFVDAALGYLNHHSWLQADKGDSILLGASKASQVEANLEALSKGPLPKHVVDACETAGDMCLPFAESYFRGYGPTNGNSEFFLQQFK